MGNLLRTVLAVLVLALSTRAAAAQSSVYVTGGAFADVKRFGSTGGLTYYGSDQNSSLNGTAGGGSVRIATFLNPRWTIELAADAGAGTKTELPYPYFILAADVPTPSRGLNASTRFLSVGALVGFHPPAHGRLRLGYFAGIAFIKATYTSDYPGYIGPVPLFSAADQASSAALAAPAIYPPPAFTVSTLTQIDYTRGAILGVESAIDLTGRCSIVPEIRALTFSAPNGGPGVILLRPGIGVRWRF